MTTTEMKELLERASYLLEFMREWENLSDYERAAANRNRVALLADIDAALKELSA